MGDYPKIFQLRQTFAGPQVSDVAAEVDRQLAALGLEGKIQRGQQVAVTAGSRGIDQIPAILRAVVEFLKNLGAQPFLVPAMGSHGGGTTDGQLKVLSRLGIREETMGCPIRASMETVVLGDAPEGFPVHFDRHAYEADHVLVCNRVLPHTMFGGNYQSGLVKMLLQGLGKCAGATLHHRAALHFGFDQVARSVSSILLRETNIVAGLAILENGYGRVAQIEGILPEDFLSRDPQLLAQATQWMARLPFDEVDVLLVDEIGKHVSGTGMDTNVIGRKHDDHVVTANSTPAIRRIVVRNVIGGNAAGIGLADFCLRGAVEQADMPATRLNCMTALHLSAAKLPLDFETDREALEASLSTIGLIPAGDARLLWIKNTKQLQQMAASVAYLDEAQGRSDLTVLDRPRALPFDKLGNLPRFVTSESNGKD